jgi:hypothetical protein
VRETDQELLERLRSQNRLAFAVIADGNGLARIEAGSPDDLLYQGLVSTLVRDPSTLQCLAESLQSQLLPQMWSQGSVTAYATLLSGGRVVVLFENTTLGAIEQYHRSKELEGKLLALFG